MENGYGGGGRGVEVMGLGLGAVVWLSLLEHLVYGEAVEGGYVRWSKNADCWRVWSKGVLCRKVRDFKPRFLEGIARRKTLIWKIDKRIEYSSDEISRVSCKGMDVGRGGSDEKAVFFFLSRCVDEEVLMLEKLDRHWLARLWPMGKVEYAEDVKAS